MASTQVVVVGAGFAGIEAARALRGAPDVDVTLVDRHNFQTFQPLLYQVATAGLNAADVAYPVRGLFHHQANLRFRLGTVTGVDWDRRGLDLDDGGRLAFDHLVVAVGAVVTWYGVNGAERHALPLYTLEDAIRVRNHVVGRFEAADADPSLVAAGALTFVVIGGGPTGVETCGALVELFDAVFRRDYPGLYVDRARVVLLEARHELLAPFDPRSRRHALDTLRARGVEVRLDAAVSSVDERGVTLTSGERVVTHSVVWAAGVRAHPLVGTLGLPADRAGRVVVSTDLAVEGRDRVWAAGDVAAIPGRRPGDVLAQLAPVAMQSGRHAGRQIGRLLGGRPTRPFRYVNRGTMATIGRRAAVAELPGRVKLRGTLAWLSWLALHLWYLAGVRNRASVLVNWAWAYLTWDRGPRLILPPSSQARRSGDSDASAAAS